MAIWAILKSEWHLQSILDMEGLRSPQLELVPLTPPLIASGHLFYPEKGELHPYTSDANQEDRFLATNANRELLELAHAQTQDESDWSRAVKRGEYRLGVYSELRSDQTFKELIQDLRIYLSEKKASASEALVFIALFENSDFKDEHDFQTALQKEHAQLKNEPDFGGAQLRVRGLHPKHADPGYRFYTPVLILNVNNFNH